jgi:hypothetical protein
MKPICFSKAAIFSQPEKFRGIKQQSDFTLRGAYYWCALIYLKHPHVRSGFLFVLGRKKMKTEVIIALVLLALAMGSLLWVEPGSQWLHRLILGR